MPNKDSFTFSDKLRKSKSVPLSKRLPSIVGGQNKQKRTLVQRAQRDLPFILVAACALLLLPFLSKNGSDDIPTPGDFGWATPDEPSYMDGGGADIMPAGAMTDPLDLILRPRSAVEEPVASPETPTKDAVSGNAGAGNTRRPWDDDRWNREREPYGERATPDSTPDSASTPAAATTPSRTPASASRTPGAKEPSYGGSSRTPSAKEPSYGRGGSGTGGNKVASSRTPGAKEPSYSTNRGGRTPTSAPVAASTPSGTAKTRNNWDDRKDYDQKIASRETKPSTTEKFGQKTKPAVRNSVVRKATEINRALRVSQMPKSGGNTGVSHALPSGQAPNRTSSPSAPNPGVRPVALQPMDARGTVGRSMTGENLYAEAARSINAMNAGRGAKANLLAAQMRDVDGALTPGAEGGSFGGAGSPRPGAGGGGPNNSNGYKVDKPWWWDMMQTRSQKWWELFQYKWREMLWTNIYDIIFNGGKQIVNCLLFGSKDVDVSHMFGASGGSPDYVCMKDGKEIPQVGSAKDFAGDFSNKTQSGTKGGDSEERTDTGSSWDNYVKFCASYGGKPAKQDGSDDGFFKVRGKCLGLNVLAKKIKSWAAAKDYQGNCDGVNNDPLDFTYTVTKNGNEKERLEKKAVIALVAKVKDPKYANKVAKTKASTNTAQQEKYQNKISGEVVVYAQMGNHITMSDAQLKDLAGSNCELTRLVALVPKGMSRGDVRRSMNAKNSEETTNGTWWYKGQITAGQQICKGANTNVTPLTVNDLTQSIETYSGARSFDYSAKSNSYVECTIYDRNNRPGVGDKKLGSAKCYANDPRPIDMKSRRYYSATITNPDPANIKVYALLAEQIDGESNAKVIYMARMDDNNRTCNKDNPSVCEYSFSTNAGGSKGFNPNQPDQTVRTDYGDNKSESSSTDATLANQLSNSDNQDYNKRADERLKDCRSDCEKNYPAGKDRQTCQDNCRSNNGLRTGNYQANGTSNSDGGGNGTARGSGRVYWILSRADNLAVKELEDLGTTLHMLQAGNFVESIIASDYCEYFWCNEIGGCQATFHGDGYCIEDGQIYNSVDHHFNNEVLKIKGDKHDVDIDTKNIEECAKVCYDATETVEKDNEHTVYTLLNGLKDKRIGKVKDIGYGGLPLTAIPQCPLYCQDTADKKSYPAALVKISEVNHLVKTSTEPVSNVGDVTPCSYLAWITLNETKNVFLLPAKWDKLPIPYDADTHKPDVYQQGNILFDELIAKRPELIDSHAWELLPELESKKIEETKKKISEKCNQIYRVSYEKASIAPNDKKKFEQLLNNIKDCIKEVNNLEEQMGSQLYKRLYIYGYASTEGDSRKECDGDKQNGKQCNYALSEDRNLFVINEIGKKDDTVYLTRYPKRTYTNLNGFTNTNFEPNKIWNGVGITISKDKYRYASFNEPKGSDFEIYSVPCGSDGANHPTKPLEDRYIAVTIAKIDNPDFFCGTNNRLDENSINTYPQSICTYNRIGGDICTDIPVSNPTVVVANANNISDVAVPDPNKLLAEAKAFAKTRPDPDMEVDDFPSMKPSKHVISGSETWNSKAKGFISDINTVLNDGVSAIPTDGDYAKLLNERIGALEKHLGQPPSKAKTNGNETEEYFFNNLYGDTQKDEYSYSKDDGNPYSED